MENLQIAINGCGSIPNKLIFTLIGITVLITAAIITEKYYEKKNNS